MVAMYYIYKKDIFGSYFPVYAATDSVHAMLALNSIRESGKSIHVPGNRKMIIPL